ncbi:hypothetical protein LTR09_004321 [Extremus antarcticus]|uniref:Alkyl hydroperoxide reductase subunit C/ Thiol specific antioxidant domain-containing protein n=1 Tax=Extremus antarcticus TaxID=702011 RepID=A0AAJ0DPV8_9PEZI|nr:hypothetical protein LTR09_004321 [Extremus antarcticus]
MASPPERFNNFLKSSDFVFVVYYRGHWCPFCTLSLKQLHEIESNIVAAHGTPLIVTAEVETHLGAIRSQTGYTGDAIVDPENLLASDLKRRGLLDVAISDKAGYEHGMAQPAVLVMQKDGTVVYQWAIVPSLIWENAQAQMGGKAAVHTTYSTLRLWQGLKLKIFG